MSSDRMIPERDYHATRRRPSLPAPMSGRAWVRRDLGFWHRCTILDYAGNHVTVALDDLEELTVHRCDVRKFILEPQDIVFTQHWDGSLSGDICRVLTVQGESAEVEFPDTLYRKPDTRQVLLRDLRFYDELPIHRWPEGSRVFAYKAVQFYPALFLLFPAIVQQTHHEVCVIVEFGDGEWANVPISLVEPFDIHEGSTVYSCTSYMSHGTNPDERWSPCRVVRRNGEQLLLQDDLGARFESSARMIAVLPKGYRMIDGKFKRIPGEQVAPPTEGIAEVVHIIRTDDWRIAAADPITRADVGELIARDHELAWSIAESTDPQDGRVPILWQGQPCFSWYRHEVRCEQPDATQLAKLIDMAVALDANVVADNGDVYH